MEKIKLLITCLFFVFVLLLLLVSCSQEDFNMMFKYNRDEKIADATFDNIINNLKNDDNEGIANMFSQTIQETHNLPHDADFLINYICGDIIDVSPASEAGVGTDSEVKNGKKRKYILSSFCVTTTKKNYFVAMKECVEDDFDCNNIGIVSIYVIEADNWLKDYVYRGDGKWEHGIHIVNP